MWGGESGGIRRGCLDALGLTEGYPYLIFHTISGIKDYLTRTCNVESHGADCDTGEGPRLDLKPVPRSTALRVPDSNRAVLAAGDHAPEPE